jgi:hypothetical protein
MIFGVTLILVLTSVWRWFRWPWPKVSVGFGLHRPFIGNIGTLPAWVLDLLLLNMEQSRSTVAMVNGPWGRCAREGSCLGKPGRLSEALGLLALLAGG